jgi:N-acetyl-anhydromuramyl-L-alanine amidase AmpD
MAMTRSADGQPAEAPHGGAGRGPTRRSVLQGALAVSLGTAGFGAASGIMSPAAQAATGAARALPPIAGCDAWAARPPSVPITMLASRPLRIIVHHTDTPNSTDYSQAHAFSLARSIQNYHMDHNGWIDTGQHFTVSRGGYVMEGRHRSLEALNNGGEDVASAHCIGQNSVSIGIENEGNYVNTDMLASHYAVLLDLCTGLCTSYGLRAYAIYGHQDFNNTDCPGTRLYGLLSRLRSDVAARIGGDPTAPTWPTVRNGDSGERVRTLQYLLRQAGATIDTDGQFGPATDSAVRSFQSTTGASVDGVAGRQTWNQAAILVARGMSGEAVRAVQSQLSAHGITTTVDASVGPKTEAGVKSFQSGASLPADGTVDARTWSRLVA